MSTLSPLPESLYKEIAKLTRVKELHYMQMRLSVQCAIESAVDQWRAEQTDFFKSSLKPLMEVKQAARELVQKIGVLDAGQKRMLQICLEDEDDVDADPEFHGHKAVQQYVALIDDLAEAIEKTSEMRLGHQSAGFDSRARCEFEDQPPEGVAAFLFIGDERRQLGIYPDRVAARLAFNEAAQSLNETARARGGRPRGRSSYPALQSLVRWLHRGIVVEADGCLTYDRKMQRGSLVGVLELLRPYVDGGLIPDPLPWHVIERSVPRKTDQ